MSNLRLEELTPLSGAQDPDISPESSRTDLVRLSNLINSSDGTDLSVLEPFQLKARWKLFINDCVTKTISMVNFNSNKPILLSIVIAILVVLLIFSAVKKKL